MSGSCARTTGATAVPDELGVLLQPDHNDLNARTQEHFTVGHQHVDALVDGGVDRADITISTDPETLQGLIRREIGPFKAYATGKIRLKGSLEDISRIRKFF